MKITHQLLSIPPYLSTTWENVGAIHMEEDNVVVVLVDGSRVIVPNLEKPTVDKIFQAHAVYMESGDSEQSDVSESTTLRFPFNLAMDAFDNMGAMLQHNPDQSDAPPLPKDMLEKVASVVKMLQPYDKEMLPKPEPHCSCFHCQIAEALQNALKDEMEEEEEVSDDDLRFRSWDIEDMGNQIYKVTNPLDPDEVYQVFLGGPVGCTCGVENCEHIEAVLRSE